MSRHAFFVLALAACGPRFEPLPVASSSAGSSTGEIEGAMASATLTGTSMDPTHGNEGDETTIADESSSGSGGCGFICEDFSYEGGDGCWECDTWSDCCAEGEKCMPRANDGGNRWNSTRCSPVADGAAPTGEPCTVEGSGASGIDSCARGAMCFWVDPTTNEGSCVAACEGTSAEPVCSDPSTVCVQAVDDVLTLCLPTCDPLLQDCERGACYPVGSPDATGFACGVTFVPVAADGAPCDYHWDCAAGSACAEGQCAPS